MGKTPEDHTLIVSVRLLDDINFSIPVIPPTRLRITAPDIIQSTAVDSGDEESSSDTSAADPGGDPTLLVPPQVVLGSLPVVQPRTPFSMRNLFTGHPNSWSMF
jgi:hypothetical protein